MSLSVAENRAHYAHRAKISDKRPFGDSKRCRGKNSSVVLKASKLLSADVKKIGCWNVRSMIDRETSDCPERRSALIATELLRLGIDIAALSETRLAGQWSFDEIIGSDGYSFFWSGKPKEAKRESGVGFAIRRNIASKLTDLPIVYSDRMMTLRLPLVKDRFLTIVSVYAPTLTSDDVVKNSFYDQLHDLLVR